MSETPSTEASILNSVKKIIGIDANYKPFDTELIIFINSIFMSLHQIGLDGASISKITSENETWDEYIGDRPNLEEVKTYVGLRAKMIFDPPQSTALSEAYRRTIDEFEWRVQFELETPSLNNT